MSGNFGSKDLEHGRTTLRKEFSKLDPQLIPLLDEPFLEERFLNLADRLLEYRTESRGILVDLTDNRFDAFFANVGVHDECRLLSIFTLLPVESYANKIALACRAWIVERQDEDTVLNLLELRELG